MKIKKIFQNIFKAIAIFIFKFIYGKVEENSELKSSLKYFKEEINFEGCKNTYNLFKIIMPDFILTEYMILQL